jgi:hypothetical protein
MVLKNLLSLSFLLVLIALGFTLQAAYADTDESNSEGDSNSKDSEREDNQESDSNQEDSDETIELSGNDTIANQTSKVDKKKFSDVLTTNQTLSQTGKSGGISITDILPPAYQVKVTFYWLQVHNDHDGTFRGSGEWDMAAFVQGIKVPLTDKSWTGICGGAMHDTPPPCGLGDIDGGETVVFSDQGKPLDAGTSVTLQLPRTVPLSIFTAGIEVDDCGRAVFPDDKEQIKLMQLMRDERLDWIHPIQNFIHGVAAKDNLYTVSPLSDPICGYSDLLAGSDKLGNIIRFYEPVDYGKSDRCTPDKSDSGDYTLCYRITVSPLQSCPASYIPEQHPYCKR